MDCSKTETFLHEWKRMCISFDNDVKSCPVAMGCGIVQCGVCRQLAMNEPELTIKIVQEWSDANQPKTRLSVLLEAFPNAQMKDNGTPFACVTVLYGASSCFYDADGNIDCVKCWNTPIEDDNNA